MTHGEFQFISDTLVMEKMMKIISKDLSLKNDIRKQASFDMSDFLASVKSGVTSQVNKNSPVESVVNMLVPAALWRINPLLGMLATAGQMFGINAFSIWDSICSNVKSLIGSGNKVTPESITQIGEQEISKNGGIDYSYSGISILSDFDKAGLISLGGIYSFGTEASGNWFVNLFKKIIGADTTPGQTKAKFSIFRFITQIFTFTIKTMFLSAGLLAAGGGLMYFLGRKPQGIGTENTQSTSNNENNVQQNQKSSRDIWSVPLNGKTPPEMLMEWAIDKYPQLAGHEDEIDQSPSFWNTVREVAKEYHTGQNNIEIPSQFKSPEDILSKFVPDIINQMGLKQGH
jgi:hypothetical protein